MRVLGLDLGTKTLGIAVSDKTNILATPLKVVEFQEGNYKELIPIIEKLITEYNITHIALGLPKNMNNSLGLAAQRSLDFKKILEKLPIKVALVDERLSTTEAFNILKATGNKHIKEKKVIDAVAASIILENYLKGKNYE